MIREYVLVDCADLPLLDNIRWGYMSAGGGYAMAHTWDRDAQKRGHLLMHRVLLGLPHGDKRQGDHINRNTLDNRRSNLRVVTHAQNGENRGASKVSKSGIRGVYWNSRKKRWRAGAMHNGKAIHLGQFKDKEEAGRAIAAWRAVNFPFSEDALKVQSEEIRST